MMTSSKTGLLLTIVVVFVVVGLVGYGLHFLISQLVRTVQNTKARDEEEQAEQAEAEEQHNSDAAIASTEPPAQTAAVNN